MGRHVVWCRWSYEIVGEDPSGEGDHPIERGWWLPGGWIHAPQDLEASDGEVFDLEDDPEELEELRERYDLTALSLHEVAIVHAIALEIRNLPGDWYEHDECSETFTGYPGLNDYEKGREIDGQMSVSLHIKFPERYAGIKGELCDLAERMRDAGV